jgi:hypothetical protein
MSVKETGVQDRQLIDHSVAGVEVVGEGAEDGRKDNAEGCENKMELDLRDAGLCSPLSRGADPDDG